jgi:RNA recognition motif-containing protein
VLEITIVRHRISGKSKGFGFVVFNSEEDKQKALQWNEKIILKDRPLWIRSPKNEDLNRESQEKNTNN